MSVVAPAGPPDTRMPLDADPPDHIGTTAVTVLAATATFVAGVPWLRGVAVPGATALLALAATVPGAVTLVTARVARLPVWASYAASAAALAVVIAAGVTTHPATVVDAMTHDPARLLTETLPLDGGAPLLLPPLLVVWLTAAATAEILTRGRRPAVALLLPIVSFALAFAATAGAPRTDDASGAILVASVGLLAVAVHRRAEQDRRPVDVGDDVTRRSVHHGTRAAVAGGLAALSLAAALAVAVPHLLDVGRAQASIHRRPAVVSDTVVDPVATVEALRDDDPRAPAVPLVQVETSAPSDGYFGLATLDDYDGDTWSTDATFQPTGGRVVPTPGPDPGAAVGTALTPVVGQYTLLRPYGLPLVPTLDRPVEVAGLTVDADAATGMVLPVHPLSFPTTYAVRSVGSDQTLGGLPATVDVDPGTAGADLAVPAGTATATSAILRYAAAITGRRPSGTVAFLQDVVAALRRVDRRVDPALTGGADQPRISRGGTSLAEVVSAVTVSHRATPAQFATLFVVAARQLGVPARLVTGFRAPAAGTGAAAAAGTLTLTDRDAWTWAEVPVAGLGWVVADPTPAQTARADVPAQAGGTTSPTTAAPGQANAVPTPQGNPGRRAVAPPVRLRPGPGPGLPIWALIALVAVGAAVLAGPSVAGLRRAGRRQLRRGRSDAPALAVGAWLELLDSLATCGLVVPADATTGEVVGAVLDRFGPAVAAPTATVAVTADRALCAPGRPPDAPEAAAAWSAQRQAHRLARASLGRRDRLLAALRVGGQPRRPVAPSRPPDGRDPAGRGRRPTRRMRRRPPTHADPG